MISFLAENIILFCLISLLVLSAVVGFLMGWNMDGEKGVSLIGGKLETSDECIKDALPHLKITNMWDTKR